MELKTETAGDEEFKIQANLLKDQGNELFQAGKTQESIVLYSQAIVLDPDNHVLYSNRCAAYMKSDSISKALHDGEKCIKLAPAWSKGYIRLGVAQQSLKRFDAALDTFKKGIEIDASNQVLWTSLRACQEAHESDKKSRHAAAALDRVKEAERINRADLAKAAALNEKIEIEKEKKKDEIEAELSGFFSEIADTAASTSSGQASTEKAVNDEELLLDFFSEVEDQKSKVPEKVIVDENFIHEKYTNQDLGDRKEQYARLIAKNYEWRNLNPYFVLQLGIDATAEDIKQRYRKLAVFLHPDKMRDVEFARECFEQVKSAYQKLCDEKEKNVVIINIEHITDEVNKERKKQIQKGAKDLPDVEDEIQRRIMKHFAEMEMSRRRSEKNIHTYSAREKMQEGEVQAKLVSEANFEKEWSEIDRREARVGSWRDFQEVPDAKRSKAANFKEETRVEDKHGVVKLQEWKKKWK